MIAHSWCGGDSTLSMGSLPDFVSWYSCYVFDSLFVNSNVVHCGAFDLSHNTIVAYTF